MDIIARLEAARDRTLKYFDLSDGQLERKYAPDKWSVRFLLHHLADAETVLFDRIRRVLSEPRQVIWAFDQDAWAKGLDYSRIPMDLSRRIYDSTRGGVIYQARLHYETEGHREFIHSETGLRTLKTEFDKVAFHNEHHLEQIELALKDYEPSAQQAEYSVSTDSSRFDIEMIYTFLTNCYWAEGVPRDVVQRSIDHALCFGVFHGEKQVGFARVITDRATYAYIGDVFILESHRGRGLSKQLMQAIMRHPDLQGFRRWSLITNDAHGLYKQFGFTAVADPQRYMELCDPDVYKRPR